MAKKNPYRMRVKDVVKKHVIAAVADDNLQEALDMMAENRVTALPVLDRRGRCEGILSASDIIEATRDLNAEQHDLGRVDETSYQWLIEAMAEHDMTRHVVGEFMTRNVTTVNGEDLLVDAAHEMLQQRVHRLPVVDAKGLLQGIISTMDVLAAFVEGATETAGR
jgi:CBS domain-containing protein